MDRGPIPSSTVRNSESEAQETSRAALDTPLIASGTQRYHKGLSWSAAVLHEHHQAKLLSGMQLYKGFLVGGQVKVQQDGALWTRGES